MTIGLFFEIADRKAGRSLLKELLSEQLPVRAFEVGSGWDSLDGSEYAAAFAELGQLVVVTNRQTLSEQWFSFVAGVGIGSDRELHIFEGNVSRSPEYPHYLSEAHRSLSAGELAEHLKKIHSFQVQQQRVQEARDQLVSSGYSLSENAFAAAVTEGNIEAVDQFLKTGMSPDTANSDGVPVLNAAVRNHQEAVAQLLVDRGADVNITSADRYNTPLMEAAGRGMISLVNVFLEQGAAVDQQTANGQTALMLAVSEGFEDTALLLLRSGADPHTTDKLGMSARKYAELYRHTQIVEEIDTPAE